MSSISMKKYRIEGLDCAQCASEIEATLRKIDGFENARVNFSTASISIPRDGLEEAEKTVGKIEPGARIVDRMDQTSGEAAAPNSTAEDSSQRSTMYWRITRIGTALLLTALGIIFRESLQNTPYRIGEYLVFLSAYILVGAPVLLSAIRNILRGRVFDEMFLMSIATLGAIAINELAEAVAVMLFYSVGEYVQDIAVGRSRRSISALMDLRPDTARIIDQKGTREVPPEAVDVGSVIEVRPGERIPLDGEVILGESSVDSSALTGESVPRQIGVGDQLLSGFVNGGGSIRLQVTKAYAESSVSRILELVEEASSRKAPTEKFISRFAAVYTPIIVAIAAAVAFLPPLLLPGAELGEWVYRALVVLVISCPCALVISVPLGYFGGIGGASRNGILIKGANFVDTLRSVSTVVVDKTGTLTKGVFRVTKTVSLNGSTDQEILELAAMAESHSSHPIANSIRDAYGSSIDESAIGELQEEKGFGVIANIRDRRILVGSDRLMRRENIAHDDVTEHGTHVHIADEGKYLGYMVISDEIKEEAAQAIADMKSAGAERVIMLTGDNKAVASDVAADLGIDSWYAELLPEEKVEMVEQLSAEHTTGGRLAFVGDGINDAPVLMCADVGFAMGALGSDAAIEAADVVLMDDRLDSIARTFHIARHTRSVVIQNILFALLVKLGFLALGAIGIATMWEAVIADVGVSVLAVLNSTRTLGYARKLG